MQSLALSAARFAYSPSDPVHLAFCWLNVDCTKRMIADDDEPADDDSS
jgi:hypothetical protein